MSLKDWVYAGLGFAVGGPAGAAAGYALSKGEDIAKASEEGAAATRRAQVQAKQQYEAENKRAEIQNIRSVRKQIRETRLAQGSMINVAAQTGGMGGSALAGGTSSIGSQLVGNINYMGEIAAQNTAIGTAALGYSTEMANASMASNRMSLASSQANTAMTIFGAVG